jgi:hypothetical protein
LPPNVDECVLEGKFHHSPESLVSSATTRLSSWMIRQSEHFTS